MIHPWCQRFLVRCRSIRRIAGQAIAPDLSVESKPPTLLDHFVGGGEKIRRDREAEDMCGAQIDDEVELGRLVDGKIAGLGPAENAIHVSRRSAETVRNAGA